MSKKDIWDKWEVVASVAGGVLVPVAIFAAGYLISVAEKNAARSEWQAEQMTDLISHLSSHNAKEQRIAVEVASFLANSGQLPTEFVPTLIRISSETESSEVSVVATQAAVAASSRSAYAKEYVETALGKITPRVYFHISDEEQRAFARRVELSLEARMSGASVVVPGIELKSGPLETELRYFRKEDSDLARQITSALEGLGVKARLRDLTEIYPGQSGIRPYHYELWFGRRARDS